MNFRVPIKWAFLALAVFMVGVMHASLAKQEGTNVSHGLGSMIPSAGETSVTAEGRGGKASVRIRTIRLDGECAQSCPSSRFISWTVCKFGACGTRSTSVVRSLAISINGRPVFVPSSAYLGMYQTKTARVYPKGFGFLLQVDGSDAAYGYATRIYFDRSGVHRMADEYECGVGEETRFLSLGDGSRKVKGQELSNPGVRARVRRPGETDLAFQADPSAHTAAASIITWAFKGRCSDICPDSSALVKGSTRSIFVERVKLFIDGQPTPPISSRLRGEGIRNATPLYGLGLDPRWVSLRAEGKQFVLRIDGGEGATANYKEFRFDSNGVHSLTVSEFPKARVAVTRFLPAQCE